MLGTQIKALRLAAHTSAGELAARAGVSRSMLSRVERGLASPSVQTLERVAQGLGVSISRFFAERTPRSVFFHVPAGTGIPMPRVAPGDGCSCELLGHLMSGDLSMTPSLVQMHAPIAPPSAAQAGLKLVYMLAGRARYRYGPKVVLLAPGDTLLFDAAQCHGVETIEVAPVRYLCTMVALRN